MIILHTLHWVEFAGTEKVCVDLCNEFSKEHEVYLLSSKKIKPYLDNNVKLIDVDFSKSRHNPFFLYELSTIIKKINPEIIHCHNAKEIATVYNSRLFLSKKVPIIATKHTLTPKKRYKLADLAIGILEETHSIIESDNSIIIKNGMAYKEPKPIKKDEIFHIVSAARLADAKGMDIIIEALSLVDFEYKCSLFGRGEKEKELKNLIKKLKLEEKIEIIGFVNNLNDHLAGADVQIIASRFEPYGLTAIDGIYYSNLLISTNTGICSEILDNDLIFETNPKSLALKLNEIYSNYNKYKKKFNLLKEKKDDFSVKEMAKKYFDAYKSVLR